MIRSHHSQAWRCCGIDWPATYRYCGSCGTGVLTMDRVVMRFPILPTGDIAVVASAPVDAETWETLAKMVAVTAGAFEKRSTKPTSVEGATDSRAGASVLAVDPSRSTPAPAVAVPNPLAQRPDESMRDPTSAPLRAHPLAPQPDDTTRDASPHRGACPL